MNCLIHAEAAWSGSCAPLLIKVPVFHRAVLSPPQCWFFSELAVKECFWICVIQSREVQEGQEGERSRSMHRWKSWRHASLRSFLFNLKQQNLTWCATRDQWKQTFTLCCWIFSNRFGFRRCWLFCWRRAPSSGQSPNLPNGMTSPSRLLEETESQPDYCSLHWDELQNWS